MARVAAFSRAFAGRWLIVELDATRAAEFRQSGVPTLLGDAANSELIKHAHLEDACALVVTLPDETAAELVVTAARVIAPDLPIIARAATTTGVRRLTARGANFVIHPELEGGLEIVRHTLLLLRYPMGQVQEYIDAVRRDASDGEVAVAGELQLLDQLVAAVRGMEIAWRTIPPGSSLAGRTLAEVDLRGKVGASVIAAVRDNQILAGPISEIMLAEGDVIGLIGDAGQVTAAERFINPRSPDEAVDLLLSPDLPIAS